MKKNTCSQPNTKLENNIFKALQHAISLQQQGDLDAAEDIYLKILKNNPTNVNALNLLSSIFSEKKNYTQAVKILNKAISISPNHASLYTNLGIALQGASDTREAKRAYMQAISLNPEEYKAYYNLGVILQKENLYNDAIICYHKALKYNPINAKAYNNIGSIYQVQYRFDEAIINFRQAIALFPNSYLTYNNLGLCLKDGKNNLKDAIIMFKKCIKLNNSYPEAWNNLGLCLKELQKYDDAIFAFNKALRLAPNNPEIHFNLGAVYHVAGNINEANLCYQNALAVNPNYGKALSIIYYTKRQLCDLQGIEKLEETIQNNAINTLSVEEPFFNLIRTNELKTNAKVALAYSQQIKRKLRNFKQKFPFFNRKEKQENIIIGYICNNFYDNDLMCSIANLFSLHDRKKFKIHCYSYGLNEQHTMSNNLMKTVDKFVDLSNYNDVEAATCIYQDQVDILIDLNGYNLNHRIEILALKPAPIQVNYLGFPGTTSSDFYDYIIADQIVCPEIDRPFYTETFAYLPKCFQITDFKPTINIEKLTRQQLNIPDYATVLCSFNDPYKFDKEFMTVWAEILVEVPNTILWLSQTHSEQQYYISDFFQQQKVNTNRILFAKPISRDKHLSRLKLVDLNLDTRIYNGPNATCNALWAGVPTITLEGQNFASRMSASILRSLDLEECIAQSTAEYKAKILELVTDKSQLDKLKNKIITNKINAALFDTQKFIKNLETIYNKMWNEYTTGKTLSIIRI